MVVITYSREEMMDDILEFEENYFGAYLTNDLIEVFKDFAKKTNNEALIDVFVDTMDKDLWMMVVKEYYSNFTNEKLSHIHKDFYDYKYDEDYAMGE